MDAERFEKLAERLERQLSTDQCLAMAERLRQRALGSLGEVVLQEKAKRADLHRKCPRCGHGDVVKHGRDGSTGRQRFRCRKGEAGGCGRTFNPVTGSPVARLRKPARWLPMAQAMAQHRSVKRTADALGMAPGTVLRWRHRALPAQATRQAPQVRGVVEADETYFRDSFKGHRGWKRGDPPAPRMPRYRGASALRPGLSAEQVPVLTAVDRTGNVVERVLGSRAEIAPALDGRIEPGSVVCSDGEKAYAAAASKARSEHRRIDPPKKDWVKKAVGGKPRKPGRMGLGRVNAHHERLKTFVNRQARGVSTRFLPHYLGWHRALRRPGFSHTDLLTDLLIQS